MPELFDDRRELNEALGHLVEVYGLPLVLARLGEVTEADAPRGSSLDVVAVVLRALAAQAASAGSAGGER